MRFGSTSASQRWAPKLALIALFAVLCATATYWALQLLAPRAAIAPGGSMVDSRKAPDLTAASRLFGTVASESAQAEVVASNIKVLGVAASTNRGSAVLAMDGQPARAFGVGERIDDRTTLREVRPDVVVIEQGGSRIELRAPDRPDVALLSAGPASSNSASPGAAPVGISPMAPLRSNSQGSQASRPAASVRPSTPTLPPAGPYGADAAVQDGAAEDTTSPDNAADNASGQPADSGTGVAAGTDS
ncbi:MAG TPA: type II secretion system protein N, partial [Burkholderiaceae bacterium]|nr:type II secretion system protein N [Burkholderiaceae bacterium]